MQFKGVVLHHNFSGSPLLDACRDGAGDLGAGMGHDEETLCSTGACLLLVVALCLPDIGGGHIGQLRVCFKRFNKASHRLCQLASAKFTIPLRQSDYCFLHLLSILV